MKETQLLEGIQFAIDNAKSVSRPTKKDSVVPTPLELGVTVKDIFSICLEHSEQYYTYGVKFGANITVSGKISKKHYRYQIPDNEASAWNTLVFEFTQRKHKKPKKGFNVIEVVRDDTSSGDQI